MLLFDEPNKDISNRIKKAKKTPNKFIPKDQCLHGVTPKMHKCKKGNWTVTKRTLLFSDKKTNQSKKEISDRQTPFKATEKPAPKLSIAEPTPLSSLREVHKHEVEGYKNSPKPIKTPQSKDIEKEYDECQMFSQKMSEYDESPHQVYGRLNSELEL